MAETIRARTARGGGARRRGRRRQRVRGAQADRAQDERAGGADEHRDCGLEADEANHVPDAGLRRVVRQAGDQVRTEPIMP